MMDMSTDKTAANSTYSKGGVSCSKDSFVVNQTLVFQIKFSGKNPALRVAAKRYLLTRHPSHYHLTPFHPAAIAGFYFVHRAVAAVLGFFYGKFIPQSFPSLPKKFSAK